jgi:hypothetical protein
VEDILKSILSAHAVIQINDGICSKTWVLRPVVDPDTQWHPWDLEFLSLGANRSHQRKRMILHSYMFWTPVGTFQDAFRLLIFKCFHSEHIKYPDANKPPPGGTAVRKSINPQPQPSPPAQSNSLINGMRAISPNSQLTPDPEELRRAISPPGSRQGAKPLNGILQQQFSSSAKGKSPMRSGSRELDRPGTTDGRLGMNDGRPRINDGRPVTSEGRSSESRPRTSEGTDEATNESAGTIRERTLSDRALSPEQIQRTKSPVQFNITGRARSPTQGAGTGESYGAIQPNIAAVVGTNSLAGRGARSPSPVIDRTKPPPDAFYPSGPSGSPSGNGFPGMRPGSTGNVTADLIRDLKNKETELDAIKRREAWMKATLSKASKSGFVYSTSDLDANEAEEMGLNGSVDKDDPGRVREMVIKFKQFRAQIQVCCLQYASLRQLTGHTDDHHGPSSAGIRAFGRGRTGEV